MSDMLGPLNKSQTELMGTLLESVKTTQLKNAYKKYLPSVLSENATVKKQATKAKITESNARRVLNGNKATTVQSETDGSADIITLKKLAGLS